MALSDASAVIEAAVITAVGGFGTSAFVWWRQNHSPKYKRRIRDAWETRADAVQKKVEETNAQRIADKDREISRLQLRVDTLEGYLGYGGRRDQ